MKRRLLASLLSLVMVLTMLPTAALATGIEDEGLCPHHTEHTAECGYAAPTEGTPCAHVHTTECYSDGTLPAEGEEKTADVCTHVHDAECGYSEGSEGSPCTFVCSICPVEAIIEALPADADATPEDVADIEAAQAAYDALTEEERAAVDSGLAAKLADLSELAVLLAATQNTIDAEPLVDGETSGDCGAADSESNVTWKLTANGDDPTTYTLTISGSGAMKDYDSPQATGNPDIAPWLTASGVSSSNYPNITELVIGSGVTSIGDYAFSRMTGLTSLEIPGSVKEIGAYAFWGCNNLSSITLNEGLETIGESAFRTIYEMKTKTLNIPASVTTIEPHAFEIFQCVGFKVSEGNASFMAKGGVLFSKDEKTLVRYPTEMGGSYEIPEGTETIGVSAFQLADITAVTIPNTVMILEDNAFDQCEFLKEVIIPDSVTTIGNSAFVHCNSLEKVTVGSGVTTIGSNAFSTYFSNKDSRVIVDMSRADKITSIGKGAFYHSTTEVSNSVVYVANEDIINLFGFGSSSLDGQLYYAGTYIMCTNGGTVNSSSITASTAKKFLTPDRGTEYTFDGWYDNPDFTGTPYSERQGSGQNQSKYYAKWKCNITFDANGGTGFMSAQSIVAGQPNSLNKMNGLTGQDGNSFTGWNTKADGSGDFYADGATVTFNEPTTLYAQWSDAAAVIGSVKYDSIGAALAAAESGDTVVVLKDSSETDITIPAGVTLSSGSVELGTVSGTDATSSWINSADSQRYWVDNQWMRYVTSGNCGPRQGSEYSDSVKWDLYEIDESNRFVRITGEGPMHNSNNPTGQNPNNYAWADYATSIKGAEICEGVTTVGAYSFCATGLTHITVADSVTTIEKGAFLRSSIEYFKAGKNIVTLSNDIFNNTPKVLAVDLTSAISISEFPTTVFWSISEPNTHVLYLANKSQLDLFKTGNTGAQNTIHSTWMIALAGEGAVVAEPDEDASNGYTTNVTHNGNKLSGWYKPDGTAATGFASIGSYGGNNWANVYYAVYLSTITFNLNGGNGSVSDVPSYYAPGLADEASISISVLTCTLPDGTGLTRENYTFAGWNTKADGSGTHYAVGANVSITNQEIDTLYAEWTKNIGHDESYTVNAIPDQVYTGKPITPEVVVKNSKTGDIIASTQYKVTYENNIDVGTASVTVIKDSNEVTLNFTITQDPSPTVQMADVSVTFGEEYTMSATAKTSAGTPIPDANFTIKYYTDEACTKGETEIAPTNAGTYYAKATLTATDNYVTSSAVAKIVIQNGTFSVRAKGYSGTYDGTPHAITVEADEGVTVTYSTDGESYSAANPSFTDAGEYTVYYKATQANHNDVTGSVDVKISKAPLTATYVSETIRAGQTPVLAVNVTGFVNEETADTAEDYSAPTVANTNTAVGEYTLTPAGGTAKNYTFNYVSGTLVIRAASTSSSTSGSSSTRYNIAVDAGRNGDVTVSPSRASYGDTVTITVDQDTGYELDELIVTDADGDEISVRSRGDGRYTFTMPRGRVTIEATFVEIAEDPDLLTFTDVSASAYYYDAVYWAVENGVTNGTSASTFSPNASCTRAQMVTFLWRAAGSPEPESTVNPFTDVSASAYYYDAVLWAVEQGITNGTSATTFGPDATVTRGQTVTFLWRYDGSTTVSGSNFADVASDAYYAGAVAWAVSEGVTNGTSATTFSPDNDCTRGQIVTFLWRYMG